MLWVLRDAVLSDDAEVHTPGTFTQREYLLWLLATPDTLLGLDVESTPLEKSKKVDVKHKRGIYYPEYRVRTVQIADHKHAWVLDAEVDLPLLRAAIDLGKEFVSFTGIDQQAIKRSLSIDIDSITHDCHHLATLVHPGGFQNGLKALTVKYIDSGLADAEKALDLCAKESAPTGHKVGEKFDEHKWGLPITTPEFALYAGLDAVYVLHLYDILKAQVRNPELIKRERWLGTLSTGQTYRGLLIEKEYAQARYDEIVHIYDEASARLIDTWGAPPKSPKRLEWLADNGLPFDDLVAAKRIKLTSGGKSGVQKPSLDQDTLRFLTAEFKGDETLSPVLNDMLTVSENSNLKTNLRGLLARADVNDRVHPNIKIMGAITGRQSVTDPPMQTFKKTDPRLRGCFIADEGMALVTCDFQNVEVRVAAALSGDAALIKMVTMGGSMHLNNAFLIFGEEITKDDPRYMVAKVGTFACLYGAGPVGLSGQLGIGFDAAKEFKEKLYGTYPEAFRWYPKRMAVLSEVVTEWGRVIPVEQGYEYKNSNYFIQSSARELLVDAVRRLVENFGIPASWVWLLVHDEIIVQCPVALADEIAGALNGAMTSAFHDVPITADVEILGSRWKGIV